MALQYHEKSSSLISLDQTLYSLRERDQPEWRFLQLLSARIDIHQIFVIFKTKNWFFFQFCMTLQCHETSLSAFLLFFNKRSLSKYKFGKNSREESKV